MMFEKKYTIDEFKKMYKEAQRKTLENLAKKMKEADKKNEMSSTGEFAFSMQNMICMNELYCELFEKENR